MPIKLIDAIRNVVRPDNPEDYFPYTTNVDEIAQQMGLAPTYCWPDELDKRLQQYPIARWMCTDTHVGLYAVYLDGEPVGSMKQLYRKSTPQYSWLSKEDAARVRDVILSYIAPPDTEYTIIDPEFELEDTYSLEFVSEVLEYSGAYMGKPVRVIAKYDTSHHTDPKYRRDDVPYYIKVSHEDLRRNCLLVDDGTEQFTIKVEDYKIPFNVKKG